MKKSKATKPTRPRHIPDDVLGNVSGGAGSGATLGPHPNPPIGPGG